MNRYFVLLTATLIASSCFTAQASSTLTGCAAKQQEIKQEIQYAETHANQHRIAGLNRALQEVTDHCSDSSLLKQRQAKVEEKQRKVQQREQELAEARADGRQSKIDKQLTKLDEARDELNEAQAALTQ